MQRHYQSEYACFQNPQDLTNQTVFHEAGHAAGIYLRNKQKQLPAVFFKIQIKKLANTNNPLVARVVDGRLIQAMPVVRFDTLDQLTQKQQLDYQCAYEADVINLLLGPLAEAKYVSLRDDEPFYRTLFNSHALHYYGGAYDLENAYTCLKYFIPSEAEREQKMQILFTQAFEFIQNRKNWKCIVTLAEYILHTEKESLSCEEAMAVFEQRLISIQ